MSDPISTDSIIDAIALIKLQSQEMHPEADEAWRSRALGTLREFLRQIDEAVRLHGPNAEHAASAEALKDAIGRIQNRARPQSRSAPQKKGVEAVRRNHPRREARGGASDPGRRRKSGRHGR